MKKIEVVAAVIKDKERILATRRGYGQFKGKWEFPGGKVESQEGREQALVREIREELAIDIVIDSFICTIEYDYPDFHLTMHCYLCKIVAGKIKFLEHEAGIWLSADELEGIDWLEADIQVVKEVKRLLVLDEVKSTR